MNCFRLRIAGVARNRAIPPLKLMLFLLLGIPRVGAEELDCLMCHESLMKPKNVHPAVAMGCALCHQEPHAKEKAELSLTADPPDLCFTCHDQKGFNQKAQHTPVAAGTCTSCHNPHASENRKLLVAAPPDLCFQCHDKKSFGKRVVHNPIAKGECLSCHETHSSPVALVLKAPVGELCASCHPKETSGTHVLRGLGLRDDHPLRGASDPAHPGSEVSCVSCHKPHSSDSRFLFTVDSPQPKSICLMCHYKVRIPPQN